MLLCFYLFDNIYISSSLCQRPYSYRMSSNHAPKGTSLLNGRKKGSKRRSRAEKNA